MGLPLMVTMERPLCLCDDFSRHPLWHCNSGIVSARISFLHGQNPVLRTSRKEPTLSALGRSTPLRQSPIESLPFSSLKQSLSFSSSIKIPRTVCKAGNEDYSRETRMREEVISPFRTVRMFLSLGFIGSAGIGTFLALVRVLGQLAGGQGDGLMDPLEDNLKDLGIDAGALVLFGLLYRRDSRAKESSLSRLNREESLAQLRLELASGRVVRMGQLRGACRLVIVAGPLSHVQRAMALARPFKNQLLERGVTVVPYVTEEDVAYTMPAGTPSSSSGQTGMTPDFRKFMAVVEAEAAALPEAEVSAAESMVSANEDEAVPKITEKDAEARWLARPLYTNEWDGWMKQQLKMANRDIKSPVYLSLRLDGRVRGSGLGFPRWQVIAAQLPPLKGMWRGPLDGMDGRVL